MGWKEAGPEIIIAIIGSSFLGTSLTTFLDNNYFQPNISIEVNDKLNQVLSSGQVDYYEIIFKNTGQKSASNLSLNMFFFANITKYDSILTSENVASHLENNSRLSGSNNQLKPSLLTVSIPRFPKNGIIVLYVWTEPWPTYREQISGPDPYYISASYNEGSNNFASSQLVSPYTQNILKYIPDIQDNNINFLSLSNVPFITIILSILSFAILYRIRKLKLSKNKVLKLTDFDIEMPNDHTSQAKVKYDIPFMVPIILVSQLPFSF